MAVCVFFLILADSANFEPFIFTYLSRLPTDKNTFPLSFKFFAYKSCPNIGKSIMYVMYDAVHKALLRKEVLANFNTHFTKHVQIRSYLLTS